MSTLELIFALPKSLYFNIKYLGVKQGIKLPILISNNVKFKRLSGKIIINKEIKTGMIKIGFGNVGIFDKRNSKSILELKGEVIFNGKADIGHGSRLCVFGKLELGNKLKITAETSIVCFKKITIGDDCIFSWQNLIMDTDFHKIYNSSKVMINEDKDIIIGNKVWVGCRCTILKGSVLNNETVVAASSVVNKQFDTSNIIIAGNPAAIVKNNIKWDL